MIEVPRLRQESYFHSNKEEMKTPIKMEFSPMFLEVHGLGVQWGHPLYGSWNGDVGTKSRLGWGLPELRALSVLTCLQPTCDLDWTL